MKILKLFFNYLVKIKAKREKKEYISGYDWAIGTMAREEMSPFGVENSLDSFEFSTFDTGALDAIEYMIDKGLVKDDRM